MNSQPSFTELNKLSKSELEVKHQISLSILGDTSTQFFASALKGMGRWDGIDLNIYEAEFDQIEQEILNGASRFHSDKTEFAILLFSTEKLLSQFQNSPIQSRADFADDRIEFFQALIQNIDTSVKIIINTLPLIPSGVFGNFGAGNESSFEFQLSKLNFELKKLSLEFGNVFICDIESLQNQKGIANRIDPKFYIKASLAYSLEFLPTLVANYLAIIKAINGIELKKCLILDLDNTTWGGIIGDDGIEGIQVGDLGIGMAFDQLQSWALELKQRGIILCICSKNTDSIAREPFEKHPNMKLHLDDISVFVANWENKADNIRHIQNVLNIGFDSMVFLDDNPFERNLIRQELPEVTVPELPEDPAEYMTYLRSLNLFETATYSAEDGDRTRKYQEEAKRVSTKKSYSSIEDYLKSLDMKAVVGPFNDFSVPRISQLTQRSNQFNLRTVRYSEEDVKRVIESDRHVTMQISLTDKFGEYGIISLLVGEKKGESLFIDTWIMSCRVLKRGVEKIALNQLVNQARQLHCNTIRGEFIPTAKNKLVEFHYLELGFNELAKNNFELDVNTFEAFSTNILIT